MQELPRRLVVDEMVGEHADGPRRLGPVAQQPEKVRHEFGVRPAAARPAPVDEIEVGVGDGQAGHGRQPLGGSEGGDGPEADAGQPRQQRGIDPVPRRHQHGERLACEQAAQPRQAVREFAQDGFVRPMRAQFLRLLRRRRMIGVDIAVHGYVHANHAPAAEKPQELGPHRPHEAILSELADGLARLRRLFAGQALPMLVPPWNRIDPALLPRLPGIGFRSISAFGPAERLPAVPGLTVANADLDLIDWRGTRRCRPHAELVADLLRLLRDRPEPSRPVGVLAHHLVHDEAAWEFLHRLFEASRGLAQWVEPV